MCQIYGPLLVLMALSCLFCAKEGMKVAVSCQGYQKPFEGSCYEFRSVQRTFFSAQAWCEQRSGHLAFIPDEETQCFIQRYVDPKKDMWFGAASSGPAGEGPLVWLDGSLITYSRWASSPLPGAACGHILRNSGFKWEATSDCNKKLPFICQFDSGRAIVCPGRNTTLQCGSGQVIMINRGFYGRKNVHYCRSMHSLLTTPPRLYCSWVDVREWLTAHCHGRQVCQITEVANSLGEPCPQLGSYLSLDYHCKDGLALSMTTVAAIFNEVNIDVHWLLDLPQGNLSCKLSTGDGHVTYLYGPGGLGHSVVHRYRHPGTFAVTAVCSSTDIHITARKFISIQEPIKMIGVIKCYAGKLSFHETNCKALYGEDLQIQIRVNAGSNVTYRIQYGEMLLSGLSVVRGNVSQNITVTSEIVKHLGHGCHQLTLYASNMVTFPHLSAQLQMCVLDKVAGLHASVLRDKDVSLHSPALTVGVSLERGAPVLLVFNVIRHNNSFTQTREMKTTSGIFHIGHQFQGCVQVKVRAWNIFSSLEVDLDMFATCSKDSVFQMRKKVRLARSISSIKITANPSSVDKKQDITLSLTNTSTLTDQNKRYLWQCKDPCKCQDSSEGLTHIIDANCLPLPFQYFKYNFSVINRADNAVEESESICITLIPEEMPVWITLTCTKGCDHMKYVTGATIKMTCAENPCYNIAWYIKSNGWKWPEETKSCYTDAGKWPLLKKQDGGDEYTVSPTTLTSAKMKGKDVTVYIIHDADKPLYKEYTIGTTSVTTKNPVPTTAVAVTKPMTAVTPTTPTAAVTVTKPTTAVTPTTPTAAVTVTKPTTAVTPTTPTAAVTVTKPTTAVTVTTPTTAVALTTPATTFTVTTTSILPPTTNNFDNLKCTISPLSGTILDAFNITCSTETPCSNCQYCFKANEGQHLRCSENNTVEAVFLPLGDKRYNYSLIISATAKNSSYVTSTTIKTQVLDSTTNSSSLVDGLKDVVENVVSQLKKQGLLSGETVGQIFTSVAKKLNNQSDESTKANRQKLREQMLDVMVTAVKNVPASTLHGIQMTATALTTVAQGGAELSPSAQEKASLLFANLSSRLLHLEVDDSKETLSAASTIVEGAGNMLDYSSNKNISDIILVALTNTQSALLTFQKPNEGPTIIRQAHINVFVERVTQENLHNKPIKIPKCSCPAFFVPKLPSQIFPSDEPVDIRMLSLEKNPFSWNERGNISGPIGALAFTTKDGSNIPVENLSEDIEILLPRPDGAEVNTTVLDLRNYSTTVINRPSANSTLVIKMVPSDDPLTFKLFLGYMEYPTDKEFVAMTEMPQQGKTQEERYTWVLEPKNLKGNTGLHYLLVRPIVGPGIKSINASLSISSITTECKFWDESKLDWSNYGCRVGVQTTHLVTQCLCNHLTFFGGSFFVTPNLVDPSRTAELFGTFAENPVVVCFVGAIFVAYFLVVVWAWRKDIQDVSKVKVTVLEDNDPLDEYRYLLSVNTGHRRGASTSSQVTITLLATEGNSEPHHLTDLKKRVFERGAVDLFLITAPFSLGDLQGIRLWHNNSGGHPAWYIGNVMVQDLQTAQKWYFLCNSWLAIDMGDCSLDKVFPVSTEMELKRFSNLFFHKTSRDFSDGHLWYSVINRPASSTFTSVQRVSCCFSLLLCTMLTSIMFYGIPTDPSEQTMDLGHFEFTWQQFMIGVQSSLIMFPVNFLIVTIFRNTRPRESSCCRRKTEKLDTLGQIATKHVGECVTLEGVIKNVTRIAHSLSKTTKSNILCSGLRPEQELDINAVLSVVEDFIKQNNKTSDIFKAQNSHNLIQPHVHKGCVSIHPAVERIQKKSNKTQYLYRQLFHIERELSQLGPSSFQSPHSHSQALQQVQGMRSILEDQIFSSANIDEPTQKKLCSADSTDSNGSWKKIVCCHRGLPWWFIFLGWLLVIATSVVAGYFTMLYGLKFGKDRSVSWLVSMIVSFFQSILIIQPLKVICVAVFFALVIKKVDEEDNQILVVVENDRNLGDHQMKRQNSHLYEPPAPADIEKMRRNMILEQKAFALLKEILIYLGFLWMLLLVAYGQRDPNAFFLKQHIRNSFSETISDSMSLRDVFTWTNTSLLNNLFGVYPGFITDGNSKLVGNARLRQLRVQRNSCKIAGSMLQFVPDCHAPYSWEVEDMGFYDPGWNPSVGNVSASMSSPWKYQTHAQLRGYPIWGINGLYRGGGFVAELGLDKQNASSTLESLFRNKWLDMYTRAIFVEFNVYNANVNLFCIITLLFETTALGAFQFTSELQSVQLYQSPGGLHIFVIAAEIICLLFILYYMFLQGKLMKQQRWAYIRSKWNLLELSIILLSWSAVAVFIKRTLLGSRDMTYYQNHKDQFASFYETASANSTLQYMIAFLVLLSTVKLWHLLRLNPKMNMITATLHRAWSDIFGFLLIVVVILLAYSSASNVIYGWKIPSYRTLLKALVTIFNLQIGIFNYDEVLNSTPLLGGLLFGSCIIFMVFVVLNLLLSAILVAFNQEQLHHKPSDEEEIVNLMLKKIYSLFGIKYRNKQDTLVPAATVGGDMTFNAENVLDSSTVNVNISVKP